MGQRTQLAFEESSAIVDQFEWYRFPAEIQRMMPLILSFTQQPVEFVCFGSIACNRETFKYVSTAKLNWHLHDYETSRQNSSASKL